MLSFNKKDVCMKIKFFVVFSILLLNGFAFCGTQDPFSMEKQLQVLQSEFNMASQELNKEKAQMRKTIIQTNINFLENCLFQKIKKNESRLEKYKNNLNDNQDEIEAEYWLKKLESAEKKIKDLNEVIFGINLLKLRMVK